MAEILFDLRPDHALYNTNLPWPLLIQLEGSNFTTPVLQFDDATAEYAFWPLRGIRYPGSGDLSIDIDWFAGATTGNVRWQAAVLAFTPNTDSGSLTTAVFDNSVEITATNLGATAGRLHRDTITIPTADNDDLALNDYMALRVARIGGNAFDTLSGDATLVKVALRYNDSN